MLPLVKCLVLGHLTRAFLKLLGLPSCRMERTRVRHCPQALSAVSRCVAPLHTHSSAHTLLCTHTSLWPSLPSGPECCLALCRYSAHTPPLAWLLAFLPPLCLSFVSLAAFSFFRPASQVPCPASNLSLHSNWEISKSVISLNTRMPTSHQARPVSWASDTSTRPPSGPSSSARQN